MREARERKSRWPCRTQLPAYFQASRYANDVLASSDKPRIGDSARGGTNGDREMASAFIAAGFDAWDISMNDLLKMDSLDSFKDSLHAVASPSPIHSTALKDGRARFSTMKK